MSNFPKLSRRDFFKGLISLGVVASFPEAKALQPIHVTKGPVKVFSKYPRLLAIWQPPGQKPKLTMFAGDIPKGSEVYLVNGQRIIRFRTYPEPIIVQKGFEEGSAHDAPPNRRKVQR